MAVDEKYVETIGEEKVEINSKENEDLLKSMGISAHYQPVSDNGLELWEYDTVKLSQLTVGDIYIGKPVLTEIIHETFTRKDKYTGEETTEDKYRVELAIVDDDAKEAYLFHANLNSTDEIVENVNEKSGLYQIAIGIMELEVPGISQYYNSLDIVNLTMLRKKIAEYDHLNVKVVQKEFTQKDGNIQYYNSFKILNDKEAMEQS